MPGYRISVSKSRSVQLPVLAAVAAVAALSVLVSVLLWRLHYEGGFAWREDPSSQFSWHPLLMCVWVVLLGAGSVIYRVTPCITRLTTKAVHAVTMVVAAGAAVAGVWAVWESHALAQPEPIPHLFSLHSWLGLAALALAAAQLLLGLAIFLFPCAASRLRAQYHHTHVFCGLAVLVLATAASVVGLTEEAVFSLASTYPQLPGKGILLNLTGLFLTVFTATVTFIATKSSFKPLD